MAAIDPSEEPTLEASDEKQKLRATLKVVRVPEDMMDDGEFDDEDDEDSEDEELNGGPSEKKSKIAKIIKAEEEDDEDEDEDDDMEDDDDSEDDAAAEALLAKIMKSDKKGKGKSKAPAGEDDDSDAESLESLEMDECVLCTLDADKVCLPFHFACLSTLTLT